VVAVSLGSQAVIVAFTFFAAKRSPADEDQTIRRRFVLTEKSHQGIL
jgi:hypothetical protein